MPVEALAIVRGLCAPRLARPGAWGTLPRVAWQIPWSVEYDGGVSSFPRRIFAPIPFVLSFVCVGSALAQEEGDNAEAMDMAREHMNDERARSHFEAGRSLYEAGAFDRAAAEFQEAYTLSNRPELLYNIYVASRDAGDVRKAASSLERYLDEMENVPDRANLSARLEALRAQVMELEAQQAAEREREAEAEARRREEEARRREEEEARRRQQAEAEAIPMVPLIVAGVGAAALIGGVVTGVLALGTVSDIDDQCRGGACSYPEFDDDRSSARTLVGLTDALLIGGTVLLAGGLTWAALTWGGDEPPPVAAACGPDGCAAELTGRF